MRFFVELVESGTLRKTADRLNISATMAGKYLRSLENELSTCLLIRTTRSNSLTEAGKVYYQHCKQILESVSLAELNLHNIQGKPKGEISINAPVNYANYVLAPIISTFLEEYPEITIKLDCDNRLMDLTTTQLDLVIRIGELSDSHLYSKKLGDYQLIYAASPEYLNAKGIPHQKEDLNHHNCLGFLYQNANDHQLNKHNKMVLESNSGEVLRQAAVNGLGIVLQPEIVLTSSLVTGELVELFCYDKPEPQPIHLLYKQKPLPIKSAIFIEYLITRLKS